MYKLIVSEFAHEDLDNIIEYIALKLANKTAAANFIDEVEKCYDYLINNPFMYEQCRTHNLKKQKYRKAVIKNYVLIYKIDESNKTVNVYRFFHSGQDYANLM